MSHELPGGSSNLASEEHGSRRGFLSRLSGWLMGLGLLSGYGVFGAYAARFLYPARPEPRAWLYVGRLEELGRMGSLTYTSPAGDPVLITKQGDSGAGGDFIALSSTCPHLGCKVHWEAANERFFCPCHNGTFDTAGVATGGPPAAAGQNLPRYVLKVENDLLFINVPLRGVPIGGQQTA
jgi:cytochrome b6-f complex iron-sulfur subunit